MEQVAFIGRDSIDHFVPILAECKAKHVFLVRGKRSYTACGAEKIIRKSLAKIGATLTEFYDFSENPKCEDMEIGIELLRSCGADTIVAVGGGSVLDMAKLIRFFSSYTGDVIEKSFEKTGELLPLIAMPTTAGTGAEATHFSVVYKDKVKYSVAHDDMLPEYAIIYPPFTYDNPKYLTACTGFDALAQSIEAFWNLNATEESDIYAEKAIGLLWTNLPDVVNNPNEEIRDKVAEGAYWAGRAINITKTTAPHAFSYPFTTYYGYPHGHAVALTFPFFMELNCGDKNPDVGRIHKLLSILGFDIASDLKEKMLDYVLLLGLQPLSKLDFDVHFIMSHVNVERLSNNPVPVNNIDF